VSKSEAEEGSGSKRGIKVDLVLQDTSEPYIHIAILSLTISASLGLVSGLGSLSVASYRIKNRSLSMKHLS
jgi:hypothetical protein